MKISILTLFPDMFAPVLLESITGRAVRRGILDIETVNIRDHSRDKHHKTDDYPFGGGAGMVMMADPIFTALESLQPERTCGARRIYLSPRGRVLDQALVRELAEEDALILLCGHYEGVDQRVLDGWEMEEISAGDYILTGGELPAMILIDAVSRLLPDVLGNQDAHEEESICSGLLEYPQYTRPSVYRGMAVPDVLLSGNHRLIRLWNYEQSLRLTMTRRPDLFCAWLEELEEAPETDREKQRILERVKNDFFSRN